MTGDDWAALIVAALGLLLVVAAVTVAMAGLL